MAKPRARVKLAGYRSRGFGLTHPIRILKRQNPGWFEVQAGLRAGRYPFKQDALPSNEGKAYPKIEKSYALNHWAVQDLKDFYAPLKETQLKRLLKNTDQAYRRRLRRAKPQLEVMAQPSSLIRRLESRLVNVLWRSFLASRVGNARVMIAHGKVRVNGRIVRQPRALLKPGDLVQLHPGCRNQVRSELENRGNLWSEVVYRCPPTHLEVSLARGRLVFLHRPYGEELRFPFFPDVYGVRAFYRKG